MGARRFARSYLDRREGHERLVREGRRPEGFASGEYAPSHEGVSWRYGRRVEPQRAGGEGHVGEVLAQDFDRLGVGVAIGSAQVDDEVAAVGHHVVLRAGLYLGDGEFRPSQPLRDEGELESPQPFDSLGSFVEGVDSLFAGSVSRPPVRGTVEHQQPLFADGRLHGRRFAHDGQIDRGQLLQGPGDAVCSRNLLFGRSQENQVVGLLAVGQEQEGGEQRYQTGSGVVAAQTVEATFLFGRFKRVAAPAGHRFHGVDVRVEQEGRFRRVVLPGQGPYVVADAVRGESVFFERFAQELGCLSLLPADRRGGNEPVQQVGGYVVEFVFRIHGGYEFMQK